MPSKQRPDFRLAELGNTYCGPNDRFVVSLIIGYGDGDDDGPKTARQAAHHALELTRDEGSADTHWYVFDRKTREMRLFEQKEIERDLGDHDGPLCPDCGCPLSSCGSNLAHGAVYCDSCNTCYHCDERMGELAHAK